MQIDNPKYIEVTIGGEFTFIVVVDDEDDPKLFIKKGIDYQVIPELPQDY